METMTSPKLTTGDLTAGCCRPITPSNEYTMPQSLSPLALIYLKVEHKWKTANSAQHLHAAHVSLDIKCNESHTSPVWTGWKWCSSNEAASQLNVFTLHTPLWWCWCERHQVSTGDGGCQRRSGAAVLKVGVGERNGNGATAHWEHQPATVRTGNMTH